MLIPDATNVGCGEGLAGCVSKLGTDKTMEADAVMDVEAGVRADVCSDTRDTVDCAGFDNGIDSQT